MNFYRKKKKNINNKNKYNYYKIFKFKKRPSMIASQKYDKKLIVFENQLLSSGQHKIS